MKLPSRAISPRPIIFYFDFLDPFAYLAATRIPRACREAEASLTLEPVNSRVMPAVGAVAMGERSSKQWETAGRAADHFGVILNRPGKYPFDATRVLETCLFVRDRSGQEAMAAVADALWSAIWADGADPERLRTALTAGRGVAVPEQVLRRSLEDPRAPEMLARVTARALRRGVTRVPEVQVDQRLYLGFNEVLTAERVIRCEQVQPGPGSTADGPDEGEGGDVALPDWTFSG